MEHGGEAARPTTMVMVMVSTTDAGAVHGSVDAVLVVGPQLPGGHSLVLAADLRLGGGATYNGDYATYALLPRPGAEHGVHLLPVPNGAGQGVVLLDLLPDGDAEVFVDLLSGAGGGAMHDDYGCYLWQHRPAGAGRGEVFIGVLPDGDFAQPTLLTTERLDGIGGALRAPNLADDLGAVYDNRGIFDEHLRRLLPLAGIGACSVAVNGLAAVPGSTAVAFDLFALLLGGLFLIILHVLRV